MSNVRHFTVRVNADSYVGRKVIAFLDEMKRMKRMSYNMSFQEGILMMGEGGEVQAPTVITKERASNQAKPVSISKEKAFVNEVPEEQSMGTMEPEIGVSDEAMLSFLGDTFSEDY